MDAPIVAVAKSCQHRQHPSEVQLGGKGGGEGGAGLSSNGPCGEQQSKTQFSPTTVKLLHLHNVSQNAGEGAESRERSQLRKQTISSVPISCLSDLVAVAFQETHAKSKC